MRILTALSCAFSSASAGISRRSVSHRLHDGATGLLVAAALISALPTNVRGREILNLGGTLRRSVFVRFCDQRQWFDGRRCIGEVRRQRTSVSLDFRRWDG